MNAHNAISLKTKLRAVLLVAATMLLSSGLSMRVDAATTSYKYDSLNRLTQVTYSDGSVIKYTYDAAGNRLTQTVTAPTPTETISTPSTPAGPTSGTSGTSYAYSTGGAVSNLVHPVQYLFNWGDGGSTSGWLPVGTTSASKSWSAGGTYVVTAQARCATHTTVLSALSSGLSVNISSTETVSKPNTPTGPTSGIPGTSYAYSTGGAVSNLGHFVQYLFDWGDGTKSAWLPVGTTSASKSWTANGTYTVTAQARCATDTAVLSASSSGLAVNINSYTITVSASPTTYGTASPSTATYASGATATVTATPNTGHFFTDWTEGGLSVSTLANYQFTVTKNRILVANFSTSSASLPNLTPYQPSGWSAPIVVSTVTGTNADASSLSPTDTLYVDWAVTNNGKAVTSSTFYTQLWVDGVLRNTWNTPAPLNVNIPAAVQDYNIGSLTVGTHTLKIVTDSTNVVGESNESDNQYTKTIVVGPNLTPYKPTPPSGAWSDKIVVSTVTGTNTDTLPLSPTDTLYVDWAVINNGYAAVSSTFNTQLSVDGVPKVNFNTPALNANIWTSYPDYPIGSLSVGTHTIQIVADSTNVIAESNESDNQYTKTIVVGPNLTPYKPSGWSDKIVVSTVTGTHTDALYLSRTDTLYVDWAVINNGSAISSTFYTQLWVDGVLKTYWSSPPPLTFSSYVYIQDYNMGSLSVGTHTLKIVTDYTNVIAESSESDNQYTKTIVVGPNRTDFNSDGKSDYLLLDTTGNGNTKVSYLNGATLLSTVNGPPITTGWEVASVNDFNGDGKPDFVLFNPSTLQTQIWYLNGATYVSNTGGPTLPSGWVLRATADFDKDGKPDYLLFNPSTLETWVWYLNGTSWVGSVDGPPLTSGWTLVSANDFNGDGKPDYLLVDTVGNTKIWTITTLNGASSVYTSAAGPVIPSGWQLRSALGNYNYSVDKKPDWLFFNPTTLQTQVWYMNGVIKIGSANGPTLPSGFTVFGR